MLILFWHDICLCCSLQIQDLYVVILKFIIFFEEFCFTLWFFSPTLLNFFAFPSGVSYFPVGGAIALWLKCSLVCHYYLLEINISSKCVWSNNLRSKVPCLIFSASWPYKTLFPFYVPGLWSSLWWILYPEMGKDGLTGSTY